VNYEIFYLTGLYGVISHKVESFIVVSELQGILKTIKTKRFGNWISFLSQVRRETPLSKGPNRVGVSSTHLRTETDTVSEMLCSLVLRIPDDGQS
jgi:hypothetical protein